MSYINLLVISEKWKYDINNNDHLSNLPDEITLLMLSKISIIDLGNLSCVNRKFSDLCKEKSLWKSALNEKKALDFYIDKRERYPNLSKVEICFGPDTKQQRGKFLYNISYRDLFLSIFAIAKNEVVTLCNTSNLIQCYGIVDEGILINLAKLAAQNWPETLSNNIGYFRIKNEKSLIEIAMLAAQTDGRVTSKFIKNFRIKDEIARIEVLKVAVQDNIVGSLHHVRKYNIKDQITLVKFAKLAAIKNGIWITNNISKFDIKSEEDRVEIAKFAFEHGEHETKVHNYTIMNQTVLIEFAKNSARKNGRRTSKHISNFRIKREQDRVEIAKIAVLQAGFKAFDYIDRYGITDKNVLTDIYQNCRQAKNLSTDQESFLEKNNQTANCAVQ